MAIRACGSFLALHRPECLPFHPHSPSGGQGLCSFSYGEKPSRCGTSYRASKAAAASGGWNSEMIWAVWGAGDQRAGPGRDGMHAAADVLAAGLQAGRRLGGARPHWGAVLLLPSARSALVG